jgi:Leucine-rich repeat (LRR) protein
MPLGI